MSWRCWCAALSRNCGGRRKFRSRFRFRIGFGPSKEDPRMPRASFLVFSSELEWGPTRFLFFFLLPRQVLEVAPEPSGLAHKQRGGHRLSPCPPIPLPQHLCAARHPGVRGQVHGPRRSNSAKTPKQLWLFFAELFYSLSGNPEPRDPPSLSLLRYRPGLEAVPWRLSNCEIA